jgi:hypothetical protein
MLDLYLRLDGICRPALHQQPAFLAAAKQSEQKDKSIYCFKPAQVSGSSDNINKNQPTQGIVKVCREMNT